MEHLQPRYKTTRQDRQLKNLERARNRESSEPDVHHAHQNGGRASDSKESINENGTNSDHFVSQISVIMGHNKSQNSVVSKEGSNRDVFTETAPECCQICSTTDSVTIACCACGGDYCNVCVGMSYDMVVHYERGPIGLKWYCNECMPAIHEAVKLHLSGELASGQRSTIAKLSEQMAEMQARMINVEQAIAPKINQVDFPTVNQAKYRNALIVGHNKTNIQANIPPQQASTSSYPLHTSQTHTQHIISAPRVHTQAATNKQTMPKQQKQHLRRNKSQLKIKSDEAEKLRRKNNIIVHNLPESAQAKRGDAEREDCERVNEMIVEAMRIDDISTIKATRLGGKRRDGKPRLLLCKLDAERERVLRKARYVRMYEDWENIFIDPDRTNQEQQENQMRREERKRQREAESIVSDLIDLTDENEDGPATGGSDAQTENVLTMSGSESQTEDVPTRGGSDTQTENVPTMGGSESQTVNEPPQAPSIENEPKPGGSDSQTENATSQAPSSEDESCEDESSSSPDSAATCTLN